MSALWTLRDVTLRSGSTRRLDSVSLEIGGGVTAVLGYSGAGKTSLLNLLVDFERPTSGSLAPSLPNVALPVFWVPQNGGLWNHVRADRHLEMVTHAKNGHSDFEIGGPADWLERFGLTSRAKAMPAELSQGERARLSVARALASDAAVLVMDEPLAHVDPARLTAWFDLIAESINPASGPGPVGRSLVFSTHQPELVLRYAERVICLDGGQCVFFGSVPDLYEKPSDSRLASLLGRANWISEDETGVWLDQAFQAPGVLRPEWLRVREDADSKLTVIASQHAGAITETTIKDELSSRERQFVHLTGTTLSSGQSVRISICREENS